MLTREEYEFWESGGEEHAEKDFNWHEIDTRIRESITSEIYEFLDDVCDDTARPVLSEYVAWKLFDSKPHYLDIQACMDLANYGPHPHLNNLFASFN